MSSASDYMVGNAPQGASYQAPLIGQQIGQQIAGMPADYMQGRQFARQRAIQDAFPNGIPMLNGAPDIDQIMSTMGRIGGGEYIQSLMPFLLQQRGAENFARGMSAADAHLNDGGGQPAGSRASPAASGPANLASRPQGPPVASPQGPQGSQPMSSTGMDNNGAETVRTIATAVGRGKDMTSAIGTIARTYQLNPDAPLQPDQVQRVKTFLANRVGADANEQKNNQQPPQQSPKAATEDTNLDDANFPLGASKANLDQLQRYDTVISYLNRGALTPGLSEQQQAQIRQRLQQLQENRNRVWDYMSEDEKALYKQQLQNAAPTNEQKNARDPAVLAAEEQKKRNELNVTRWDKDQQAYNKIAGQADEERPQLAAALKMTQEPGFITGSGQKFQDAIANLRQSLGLGQNASTNQIFDKIRAGGILGQIKGMAGTGPVRVAEMRFIETMMAGRENQPEALRAVLNIQDKLYGRAQDIRDLIMKNGGNIDKRVEGLIHQYVNDNPLFSKGEMKDYHAIGAPTINAPADVQAALQSGLLRHGDPFRKPDGEIRYVP